VFFTLPVEREILLAANVIVFLSLDVFACVVAYYTEKIRLRSREPCSVHTLYAAEQNGDIVKRLQNKDMQIYNYMNCHLQKQLVHSSGQA